MIFHIDILGPDISYKEFLSGVPAEFLLCNLFKLLHSPESAEALDVTVLLGLSRIPFEPPSLPCVPAEFLFSNLFKPLRSPESSESLGVTVL
jgi:hypothetical protein